MSITRAAYLAAELNRLAEWGGIGPLPAQTLREAAEMLTAKETPALARYKEALERIADGRDGEGAGKVARKALVEPEEGA